MIPLTDLPTEVILSIASFLDIKELSSLIQTAHYFKNLLDPQLLDHALTSFTGNNKAVFEWAAAEGNVELIHKLRNHAQRGNKAIPEHTRNRAVYFAAKGGHEGLLEFLVNDLGGKVSCIVQEGWGLWPDRAARLTGPMPATALHKAVEGRHESTVRKLLELGADPNMLDVDRSPPLCLAVFSCAEY